MSGPIVRKYGFPNFEQIFGKREPQHGVEEPADDGEKQAKEATESKASETPKPDVDKK
jgi:hypothetical protein